ncbi:hypothetical protein B1992_01765 [Pseudoxanthomonas broegbernensis]|uniref:Zinc finger CHC2-type domain-containing protein n=1 Tax=Pseudoxanthomonas broegbernensis TaxID=83619 RepID=A0A7V8GQA1_9GAMM|nr:CHC2 zinc finger domain-containing protein [Pseudoxanthomonas broegbernensis]KAF1688166.1 hypothetical protein B1992_01765 [Pseudoxanthomonas broegbernensis]MBB6065218.1 hypothetical protein [Pseudoxanthomonas broegbernensis]
MKASLPMNTRQAVASMRGLYGKPRRLPEHWRDRLPDPDAYYRARIPSLGKAHGNGWAQGRCPFHDDGTASLSVNLAHGGWKCFAGCGGGDLVGFHVRVSGLPFTDAVRDLLGVRA